MQKPILLICMECLCPQCFGLLMTAKRTIVRSKLPSFYTKQGEELTLLRILLEGVESKNDIGALVMLVTIPRKSF